MALVPASPNGVWEVVASKGVIVRQGRELSSPAFEDRLSAGSLVQEVELIGDRLRYNRIDKTGYGPDSGWVTTRTGRSELLIPTDLKPPAAGWKVLERELPEYGAHIGALTAVQSQAGPGSCVPPQKSQTPGDPFVFYRKVGFVDTKPTGLRMSACLASMDDCRADLFTICDQTVESFRKVTDPFVQVAIELLPGIKKLAREKSNDGLLMSRQDSAGAVLSWLRAEARFGWPAFPIRHEEQHLFLVGKRPDSTERIPIARGRFAECFVDDSQDPPVMLDPSWEEDTDKFFAPVKMNHSSPHLDERHIHKMYPSGNEPFAPSYFQKVTWRMTHSFSDLWSLLYHAKVPELLWDLNALAGGPFSDLTSLDPDPQAMAINLPKKMQVGTVYDAYCFLEPSKKKACYLLVPSSQSSPTANDVALAVVGKYSWTHFYDGSGASDDKDPKYGGLYSEDVLLTDATARRQLLAFACSGEVPGKSKALDLSKLQA